MNSILILITFLICASSAFAQLSLSNGKAGRANHCGRMVEVLENRGNGASYMGKVFVGGQKLDILWDTGDEELMVASVNTINMGVACRTAAHNTQRDCYDKSRSKSYSPVSKFAEAFTHGHDVANCVHGTDEMTLVGGRCHQEGVDFLEIISADTVRILGSDDVDAIGGLGPKKFDKTSVMKQLGVDQFSFCLWEDTSSPGMIIWNDYQASKSPEGFKFVTVPNHGGDHWATETRDFHILPPGKDTKRVACHDKPCFCVMDSGSSLISVDKDVLGELEKLIDEYSQHPRATCGEHAFKKLPILKFYIGGQEHRFRPEEYLLYTESTNVPHHVRELLHFTPDKHSWLKTPGSNKECVFLFTPPVADGMCVLGAPFFRKNMITFDREERTVSIAPHDGECKPRKAKFWTSHHKPEMSKIDLSQVRASGAYEKLSKMRSDEALPLFL